MSGQENGKQDEMKANSNFGTGFFLFSASPAFQRRVVARFREASTSLSSMEREKLWRVVLWKILIQGECFVLKETN